MIEFKQLVKLNSDTIKSFDINQNTGMMVLKCANTTPIFYPDGTMVPNSDYKNGDAMVDVDVKFTDSEIIRTDIFPQIDFTTMTIYGYSRETMRMDMCGNILADGMSGKPRSDVKFKPINSLVVLKTLQAAVDEKCDIQQAYDALNFVYYNRFYQIPVIQSDIKKRRDEVKEYVIKLRAPSYEQYNYLDNYMRFIRNVDRVMFPSTYNAELYRKIRYMLGIKMLQEHII